MGHGLEGSHRNMKVSNVKKKCEVVMIGWLGKARRGIRMGIDVKTTKNNFLGCFN